MRKLVLLVAIMVLFPCVTLLAQTANLVLSGATIRMVNSGSVELVLANANLVNNASTASFVSGTGTVRATGNIISNIEGTASTEFNNLRIDKSGSEVDLLRDASVKTEARLTAGNFDLNNATLDLGTVAVIAGEVYPNGSRFYCADNNTGRIRSQRTLTSGANNDIAGLALDLMVTGAAPGSTVIYRGHDRQASTVVGASGSSIGRYYDITPTVTSGYTYSFLFRYHDQELGGMAENNFVFYRSPSYGANTADWQEWGLTPGTNSPGYPSVGSAVHNVGANTVSLTGISEFARWTVSNSAVNPLPIELSYFSAQCVGNRVVLNWETETEINNQLFEVKRSSDMQNWETVLTKSGAGFSNYLIAYNGSDERPLGGISYYRLSQRDYDGTSETFAPVSVLCSDVQNDNDMRVYPNPVSDIYTVSITSAFGTKGARLGLFDINGKMIQSTEVDLMEGTNEFSYDRTTLTPGTYTVRLISDAFAVKPVKVVVK